VLTTRHVFQSGYEDCCPIKDFRLLDLMPQGDEKIGIDLG